MKMTTETLIFWMIGILLLATVVNIIHTFQVQKSLLKHQVNFREFLEEYVYILAQTNECLADLEDDFNNKLTKEK